MKTFKEYLYEEEQLAATPAAIAPLPPEQQAMMDKALPAAIAATAGMDEKKDDIVGTGMDAMIKTLPPEDQQTANEFIVRNYDGTVDGDETMMKMADALANLGTMLYEAFSKLPKMLETMIQNKDPNWVSLPPEKQQEILKDIEDMKAWLPKWKADMDKASAEWEKQKPVMRQQVDQRANDRFKNKTGMDMVRGGAGQKTNIGTDPNNPGGPGAANGSFGESAELARWLKIAGLKEADAPAAAPAPTTTAIVSSADVDPAETALKSAQVDPQLMQQVEANTVRDAEGDVDLSATFQKIADQIPAEPQIRAEWAEAFKQFDEKFSHIEQDPEFMKMTPEEQVETKQDVQEVRALFQKFMEFAVQMSNTVKSGAQQVRTAMAAPGSQNPLKGVKTLTPPVQETADDKLLKQMLSIAGLR